MRCSRRFRIGLDRQTRLRRTDNLLDNNIIAINFWVTLKVYVISMLISIVIGIPLGLAMGGSKWVDASSAPTSGRSRHCPESPCSPSSCCSLHRHRQGSPIKYIIIILTAVFPIIINTWAGVKTTDRRC